MDDVSKLATLIERIERHVSFLGSLRIYLTVINAIMTGLNFIMVVIVLAAIWQLDASNDLQNVRLDIIERKIEVRAFLDEEKEK